MPFVGPSGRWCERASPLRPLHTWLPVCISWGVGGLEEPLVEPRRWSAPPRPCLGFEPETAWLFGEQGRPPGRPCFPPGEKSLGQKEPRDLYYSHILCFLAPSLPCWGTAGGRALPAPLSLGVSGQQALCSVGLYLPCPPTDGWAERVRWLPFPSQVSLWSLNAALDRPASLLRRGLLHPLEWATSQRR